MRDTEPLRLTLHHRINRCCHRLVSLLQEMPPSPARDEAVIATRQAWGCAIMAAPVAGDGLDPDARPPMPPGKTLPLPLAQPAPAPDAGPAS